MLWHRALVSALLSLCLVACTDLRAVNTWATGAVDATKFNQVVTTYTDTPDRLARYHADNADFFSEQAVLRQRQAQTLQATLGIVEDYMSALAAISSDEPVRFDDQIRQVKGDLVALEVADEETLNSVATIVSVLASEAIQAWRAGQAAELIEAANPSIQQLLGPDGQLYQIVDQVFRSDLMTERTSLQIYFEARLREADASRAAKAGIMEWRDLRLAELDRRIEAIDGYTRVLANLATGHQELFDNQDSLGSQALARRLFELSNGLQQDVRKLIRGG